MELTTASLEVYKLDEKQEILKFQLNAETDAYADLFQYRLTNNLFANMKEFHEMINLYATGGTCLDVGSSYGAQYFSMKKNCPKVTWTGCEVASQFTDKFRLRLDEGENPEVVAVTDYTALPFKDSSFDVVTSKSTHRHYSPEHGFLIIDEMIRVAKRAVVVQFLTVMEFDEDIYTPIKGILAGKGMLVEWAKPKWDKYIADKNVITVNESQRLFVFLKN